MTRLGDEGSAKVPAIVIGTNITALGVLRSLGRAGIPQFLLAARPGFVAYSRWYRAVPGMGAGPHPEVPLAQLLERLDLPRAVLVPCSDDAALAVAGLPERLRARFPSSLPTASVLETFIDKAKFAELLQREGVPHPRTVPFADAELLARVDEDLLGNAFLKPRDSLAFSGRFGVKGFRVSGRADALARLEEAEAADLDLMLQEYIPGPPSAHVFVDGFVDRYGAVRVWFARRRLRMYPPQFGNSSFMVSIPLSEARGAIEAMERIAGAVGHRGMFSAEFKFDARDERFKILEVNARAWWYVEFAAVCGGNICAHAYQDALELPPPPVDDYRVGVRCVYPDTDVRAFRYLRRTEGLGFVEWTRSWLGANQPVFRWDDPLPGIMKPLEFLWRRRPLRKT